MSSIVIAKQKYENLLVPRQTTLRPSQCLLLFFGRHLFNRVIEGTEMSRTRFVGPFVSLIFSVLFSLGSHSLVMTIASDLCLPNGLVSVFDSDLIHTFETFYFVLCLLSDKTLIRRNKSQTKQFLPKETSIETETEHWLSIERPEHKNLDKNHIIIANCIVERTAKGRALSLRAVERTKIYGIFMFIIIPNEMTLIQVLCHIYNPKKSYIQSNYITIH